jgi:hypothetical protein
MLMVSLGLTLKPLTSPAQTADFEVDYNDTIHLKKNKRFKGYSVFDTSNWKKKVFIAGENHTYLESNSRLWVQNIKYLHKYANVRHVLMEHGRSSSWLINQYITTGDSQYYYVIKKYMFEEYATAANKLMKFNRKLDSSDKVRVVGIDLERGGYGAIKVLSMLIPEDRFPHDSIDLHIESIMGMAMYQDKKVFNKDREDDEDEIEKIFKRMMGSNYSLMGTIQPIVENFAAHEEHYKDFLGDNFELFKEIVLGLKETIRWRNYDENKAIQDYVFREKYMYKRFLQEYGARNGGFYGQFGRCHSSKRKVDGNSCEWYVFRSLAHRIKNSRVFDLDSAVVTMGIMYKREDLYRKEDWAEAHGMIDELFDSLDDQRVLLYDLHRDTALSEFLGNDFDYLFLNSNYPDKEHPYYREQFDYNGYDSDITGKIVYSHGLYDADLSSIGALHSSENREQFNEPLTIYGLAFTTGNEEVKGLTSTSYFGVSRTISNTETDSLGTVTSNLKGYIYKSIVSYDLLAGLEFLDLEIGGSIGYSQFALNLTRDNPNAPSPISSGFIGDRSESVYRNPAVTAGLIGNLDINIGPLTIGGSVMSIYDLSKKDWRIGGELIQQGPQTSFRGFLGSARVGFNFEF